MDTRQANQRDRRFASTLAKGLSILQAFSPSRQSLGNRALARLTGMPPPTVARMTFTLKKLGFLQQSEHGDSYRLGSVLIALGYVARSGFSFLSSAEPLMQALADDTGTLVALAMREQNDVMLTRCWRPHNTASLWLGEGHRISLNKSSPGRAILAASGQDSTDDAQLINDRSELQTQGFITSLGGWNKEVNACAVPFIAEAGQEPVAFLCGATRTDLTRQRIESAVGPLLRERVRDLERSLGLSDIASRVGRE